VIFYLGRLFNLVAWIGLIWLAIRLTPVSPLLFTALALMPMTLFLAASNSPDAFTIAIGFLFAASALRLIPERETPARWTEWAQIGLLMMVLVLCKSIISYLVLGGLLVIAPFRQFRHNQSVLLLTLAVLAGGLLTALVWQNVSTGYVSEAMMNTLHTPTTSGFQYVLLHPAIAAPIFLRSIIANTTYQLSMFIGILGWSDTVLPAWIYPLYYAFLLFIIIFEPHPRLRFTIPERVWIAGLVIAADLLMMAAFFYPDATVKSGLIGVVKGRYFIPFAQVGFMPFSQRKRSISTDSPPWIVVVLFLCLVLGVSARVYPLILD
jgi:uncharacterized membrane protein